MNSDRRSRFMNNDASNLNKKLDINLDIRALDIICKMVVSNNQTIRRGHLINIRNLIYMIRPENYINDNEKSKRISFIKKGIEARLEFNINDPYMVLRHISGDLLDDSIINLDDYKELTSSEIAWMNGVISECLKSSHIYNNIDNLMDICSRIKSADYGSKADIMKEFEGVINGIQNDFRKCKNENQIDEIFSLREGYFENVMYDTYRTLSSPRRKLITGMQGMNELLGGGFENGRCYVYFGLPGEGKSTVILNIMYQIKKYNKDYRTKDPTKRPCVVLLTMENTVTESIERLFGMATNKYSMTDFSVDSVIKMMKEEGELYLNDESPIDIIIKFVPSNSVDTSYLYTLTEDLEDQGLEVIAMFQDYIGRIRSVDHLQDIRLEYGAIIDEFKTYAEIKDVPVISVAQLNRDASKHIDEAKKTSKSDLVRLIGRSNISESMLILNNIDAGFLIAPEFSQDGERFLGIQRIKIRYKAGDRDFLYLPFISNSLKLSEDLNGIANYKTSMRSESPFGSPTVQSQYQTNTIMDMGQIMRSSSNDENIFSTKVISNGNVSNDLSVLRSSMPIPCPPAMYFCD